MAGAHFTIDTSGLRQIQERVQVMAFQFNPRPPLLAGESWGLWSAVRGIKCFNPRPPLLTGESRA